MPELLSVMCRSIIRNAFKRKYMNIRRHIKVAKPGSTKTNTVESIESFPADLTCLILLLCSHVVSAI